MNATTAVARIKRWPWYRILDVAVLGGIGALTFAGSAQHILYLARQEGQTAFGAWSVVGSLEILALFAGIEIQRRHGWSRVIPLTVLAGAVVFVLAANLATADGTFWGRAVAVAPPAAFFGLVFLAETRRWRRKAKRPATPRAKQVAPARPSGVASIVAPRRAKNDPVREAARQAWIDSGRTLGRTEVAELLGVNPNAAGVQIHRWGKELAKAAEVSA